MEAKYGLKITLMMVREQSLDLHSPHLVISKINPNNNR